MTTEEPREVDLLELLTIECEHGRDVDQCPFECEPRRSGGVS